MIKKIIYILSVIAVFSVLCFTTADGADLGNFNDYSSGGSDSDYGGGFDSDYGAGYGDIYVGDGTVDLDLGNGSSAIFIILFAVIIIVSSVYKNKGGKGTAVNRQQQMAQPPKQIITLPDYTNVISAAIAKNDPMFDYAKFITWAKEVFFTLQYAWSERDFSKVRPFEKEELYKQHEMQIKEYIDKGWINVLERININNAYLYKYVRDAEYEHLTVFMQTRMTDYIIDESTRNVLKGNPNADCFLQYLYTFSRKTGVLTSDAKSENSIVACPHCGAPTKITSAGQCEFCGFIVTTGEYSWVLSNIEGVKSNVSITPGGVFIND